MTVSPAIVTRPSAISVSAARREATPGVGQVLARGARRLATLTDVDLERRSTASSPTAASPRFRAGQVWEWLARGAASYEEMTNLPLELREALAAELPLSTLTP